MKKAGVIRRMLHQLAELSENEKNTSEFISGELMKIDRFRFSNTASHAVMASQGGSGGFILRADMDALPIDESHLLLDYKSNNKGVSHKCGHDGHSAILIELARKMKGKKGIRNWHLLFQHAEETGKGALELLNRQAFKAIQPDMIFGMHNIPGFPLGTVLIKSGTITSSVASLKIVFEGRSSHASEPENGNSPMPAITYMLSLNTPKTLDGGQMCTVVYLNAGQLHHGNGTSPGRAELKLTLRAATEFDFLNLKRYFQNEAEMQARKYQLKLEITEEDKFISCYNHPAATQVVLDAAVRAKLPVQFMSMPFAFGEDFGFYSHEYASCFFGLGAGLEQVSLHHPDYDFPDKLIEPAVLLWQEILFSTYLENES